MSRSPVPQALPPHARPPGQFGPPLSHSRAMNPYGGPGPVPPVPMLPRPHPQQRLPQHVPSQQDAAASQSDSEWNATHRWSKMTRTIAHYERIEQIGEGTYGQVYRARCLDTGRIVALKKIRVHHGGYWGMPPTVIREIKILKRLRHPHLVQLHEVVSSKGVEHLDEEDERKDEKESSSNSKNHKGSKKKKDRIVDAREGYKGNLFLVLEYVSHDLTGLMDVAYRFSEVEVKCIFRQLLEALKYMHEQKYVHRDIKSSNILIDSNFRVKLADFGLARCIEPPILENIHDRGATREFTNKVITLWYRPPEVLLGATVYGPAVDVWSAGCILAELLLGRPLFPGDGEMDQLKRIFDLLGTPNSQSWEGFQDLKLMRTGEVTIEKQRKPKLREKYGSKISGPALNLLEKLLELDPSKRLTAERALESRYFLSEPRAPLRPEDLGPIRLADGEGHFHEFQTKKKRREAKSVAQRASNDAKARGLSEEEVQAEYDAVYRDTMKRLTEEAKKTTARGSNGREKERETDRRRREDIRREKDRKRHKDDDREANRDSRRREKERKYEKESRRSDRDRDRNSRDEDRDRRRDEERKRKRRREKEETTVEKPPEAQTERDQPEQAEEKQNLNEEQAVEEEKEAERSIKKADASDSLPKKDESPKDKQTVSPESRPEQAASESSHQHLQERSSSRRERDKDSNRRDRDRRRHHERDHHRGDSSRERHRHRSDRERHRDKDRQREKERRSSRERRRERSRSRSRDRDRRRSSQDRSTRDRSRDRSGRDRRSDDRGRDRDRHRGPPPPGWENERHGPPRGEDWGGPPPRDDPPRRGEDWGGPPRGGEYYPPRPGQGGRVEWGPGPPPGDTWRGPPDRRPPERGRPERGPPDRGPLEGPPGRVPPDRGPPPGRGPPPERGPPNRGPPDRGPPHGYRGGERDRRRDGEPGPRSDRGPDRHRPRERR